ncbi:hypothetical protein NDU88_003105 [Pleurodeles waltl]|uniref:Kinesin motor domain-containing protein n=1 Tax=Pleurodeles waltl TaxID=8319 RepID=A0AAV7UB75_PLEWA|nr:hypothetical protein NDU88_003105 [Pleurodeles waltl]
MYTLRYANRAKRIKNRPMAHMDPKEKLLRNLEEEIQCLKAENVFLRQQLPLVAIRRLDSIDQKPLTSHHKLLQRHSESREGGSGELTSGGPPGLEQGLYGMLQEFLSENEKLRRENLVLMNSNNSAKNTTRALSHENDQLVRKLEELERVLSSSPTVSSRSFSGNSQSLRISSPDTSGHYLPKLPSICSCHCCHLCHQYCPSAAPPVPQLLPDLPPIEMFTGANSGQPQHNDLDPTQGLRTHRSAPHRSQQQQPALKTK